MATIVNNPNDLGGNATTVKEFTTAAGYFRVELRRLLNGTTVYFWTRVTVIRGSNSVINPVCVVGGTTVESGWMSGDNWTPGSIYCSKAIGTSGYPAQVSSFTGKYGIGAGAAEPSVLVAFTSV